MFTVIRIALTKPWDRASHTRPQISEVSDEAKYNPWKKELKRLSRARGISPINPQLRRPGEAGVVLESNVPKATTLTGLSAWWGKSLAPQTPLPGNPNKQSFPKRVTRWNH